MHVIEEDYLIIIVCYMFLLQIETLYAFQGHVKGLEAALSDRDRIVSLV
jgi:hypothetical protein